MKKINRAHIRARQATFPFFPVLIIYGNILGLYDECREYFNPVLFLTIIE